MGRSGYTGYIIILQVFNRLYTGLHTAYIQLTYRLYAE